MPTETDTTTESDSSGNDAVPGEQTQTTSTATRYWATNDLLAGWLILTTPTIVAAAGYGYLELGRVPAEVIVAWLLLALGAGTWAFGVELVEHWSGGSSGGGT